MCFTVQLSRLSVLRQLVYFTTSLFLCQELFSTFLKLFLFLSCSNFDILSHPTGCCQELFSFLFDDSIFIDSFFVLSYQRQLAYNITLKSESQPYFSFFYNFFCGCFSAPFFICVQNIFAIIRSASGCNKLCESIKDNTTLSCICCINTLPAEVPTT